MKVKRNYQCKGCPWRVGADPNDIPNGYTPERHRALIKTIANPDDPLSQMRDNTLHIFGCHEHDPEEEVPCVGWLHHQLNGGNNVKLRLAVSENKPFELHLRGKQHETFEDTLPETMERFALGDVGDTEYVFDGVRIASTSSEKHNSRVWRNLRVFRDVKGRYIVQDVVVRLDKTRDQYRVHAFDSFPEVAVWLKLTPLGRELLGYVQTRMQA